jgi:hypothetical protein
MLDNWEQEARAAIPRGYGRVESGEILPDDLVWSWTSKEWLRSDDTTWLQMHLLAEDCVCVIRRPKAPVGYGSARTFTIKKTPEPVEAPAVNVVGLPLFDS